MAKIIPREVDNLIETSLINIKSHFRDVSGRCGWHQYLGTEKIGNIATAQALILLTDFREDFDKKHSAIQFLLNSQQLHPTKREINGGWTYVTNFSDLPTTEATCWALQALYFEKRNDDRTKKGIEWLLNNHLDSNTDEGWGTLNKDVSRIYTTCLALRVLHLYQYDNNEQFEKAVNWMIKSQNSDFGWGERFGHASTIAHTSHVILTLGQIKGYEMPYIKNGVNWLLDNFNSLESGELQSKAGYQEIIEFEYNLGAKKRHHRLQYYHMPIPYALMALVKTGNIHQKIVFDGYNALIKNNNGGYWNHPHLESIRVKPLWAIYDTLASFKILIDYCEDWIHLREIQLKNNKIILIKNSNPFTWDRFLNNFILGLWGKIFVTILACVFVFYICKIAPNWSAQGYGAIILLPLMVELLGYYITEVRRK